MDPITIVQIVGMVVYTGVEYWLGKTDKTNSGSVLELLLNTVKGKK